MEIILRGVRGSIASPGPETAYYGGNTACIDVRTRSGTLIIFDAGTGLCDLGQTLPEEGVCHLFISHTHADHIQGLSFFAPMHSRKWTTHLYLPEWLSHVPEAFFTSSFFPVPFHALQGNIIVHPLSPGETVTIQDGEKEAVVEAIEANHPGRSLAYRLHADDAVFLYTGDHEITEEAESRDAALKMLEGANIAVVDAMYSRMTYRAGWGHSTWEDWVQLAARLPLLKVMVLSHHKPRSTDRELDALQEAVSESAEKDSAAIYVGREGMLFFSHFSGLPSRQGSNWLEIFLDELSRHKEETTILDRILARAREITRADAGTIFLAEEDALVFAYTHNDTLFTEDRLHKFAYSSLRLPVSRQSIAGYVAATGEALNIRDVRSLPEGVPYVFNDSFDKSTGYLTRSMLTLPFSDHHGKLSGIIQLINSKRPETGESIPFTRIMEKQVAMLAREAAIVLERSAMLRQSIYRILHMAAVHDPVETGPHAERVGAIAAELYQLYADRRNIDPDTIRYQKGAIRLAAMLHDIGKVGIDYTILKKPGKLTDEEFIFMRSHTRIGGAILGSETEGIIVLASDIALHHHQKWDGSGYCGSSDEGRLSGEDIPLAARITAIADVFDALVSPRCYKRAWTFDEAFALIQSEAGKHFDPALVECMLGMKDMLHLIYERFPDDPGLLEQIGVCPELSKRVGA